MVLRLEHCENGGVAQNVKLAVAFSVTLGRIPLRSAGWMFFFPDYFRSHTDSSYSVLACRTSTSVTTFPNLGECVRESLPLLPP